MSVDEAKVRDVLAQLLGQSADGIQSATPLNGPLHGSLGRARLTSALRSRLGVNLPRQAKPGTFGELLSVLSNGKAAASVVAPPVDVPAGILPANAGSCGIDIELVERMPVPKAGDYWEEPFYRDHFSPAEIAYCCLQANPRMHFAARWCAKESLLKCAPEWMPAKWCEVELVETPSKQLSFTRPGQENASLPVSVSITHTEQLAAAVVLRLPVPTPSPKIDSSLPSPVFTTVAAPRSAQSRIAFLFSAVAFLLAVIAVLVAWLR